MGTHPIFESDFDCLTEPNMKLFGFFGLLGVVFSEEAARLIASKTTESKILAQNVDLTFTYKIFNIGQGSAFNVEMKDENFDTDFEVVGGSSEGKWDVIEKDSSVTHEVTVRALKAGAQNITSAVFTYKTAEDADDVVTMFSSDYGTANIIEEREYLRKHASHLQDWVVFILLSIPSLVFPYLLYFKSKSKYEGKSKRS